DDGEDDERIEEEDGFFRRNERAEKSDVEGRFPRILRGQSWVLQAVLDGEVVNVGVEKVSEAVELIKAVEQEEESVDGKRYFCIAEEALPHASRAAAFEAKHEQEKNAADEDFESGGEAREQIQAEGGGADEQGTAVPFPQPFVLIGESDEREEHDVVVFHHVLRVVKMRGAENQGERAGDGFARGKLQLAQKTKTD